MRKNFNYLLLVFSCVAFLTACNDTDDVNGIFTNNSWKLTEICDEKGKPVELWNGNQEAKQKSYELKDAKGSYVLKFEGLPSGDEVSGEFSGSLTQSRISGRWSANGKKGSASIGFEPGNHGETDALALRYIDALGSVYRYEGDYSNLRLYYEFEKMGVRNKGYLLMRPGE